MFEACFDGFEAGLMVFEACLDGFEAGLKCLKLVFGG